MLVKVIFIASSHTVQWNLLLTVPYLLHVTNTTYGPCKVPSIDCRIDLKESLVYSISNQTGSK